MPLLNRMHRLHELFKLRVGPGAATLPRDVTRIHLQFAKKINNGHFGPRKFWQQYLPRLKYYNPGVSMTVQRVEDQASPATMTVYFSSKEKGAPASPIEIQKAGDVGGPQAAPDASAEPARTETLDMQHIKEDEIYQKFLDLTRGQVIEPTEEEKAEVARLEQEAMDKAIDSKKKKAVMYKMREEAKLERQLREAAKASV